MAALGTFEVMNARSEIRFPTDDLGKVPLGIVVVQVGLFLHDAGQIGTDRDPFVGQFRIIPFLVLGRADDLVLLPRNLMGVGGRVVAVIHQIREGQKRPNEDFFHNLPRDRPSACRPSTGPAYLRRRFSAQK